MPRYQKIRFVTYDTVTANPTRLLPDGADNGYRTDAHIRAVTLTNVADWTRRKFTAADIPGHTLNVFVAPEFFFRYGGPSDPDEALRDSYPNGDATLPDLVDAVLRPRLAGQEWADWLFVPGTMFWHRPPCAEDPGPRYFNTVPVVRGGPRVDVTGRSRAIDRDPGRVPVMGGGSLNEKRLMSPIDYARCGVGSGSGVGFGVGSGVGSGVGFGVGSVRQDRLNEDLRLIPDDWEWWRRHVFSVQDVLRSDGTPLVFGVEVCLEHTVAEGDAGPGVLRTLCDADLARDQGRPGEGGWTDEPPEIDVQVLTACGRPLDQERGVAARVKGYVVRCDGTQPADEADWPVTAADLDRVTAVAPDGRRRTRPVNGRQDTELPLSLQLPVRARRRDKDHVTTWPALSI